MNLGLLFSDLKRDLGQDDVVIKSVSVIPLQFNGFYAVTVDTEDKRYGALYTLDKKMCDFNLLGELKDGKKC